LLRGVTTLSVDTKGRMAVPSKYRELLGKSDNGQMVVTMDSQDPCLLLYPLSEWQAVERQLVALPGLDKGVRKLKRLLMGYASECELDGAGRILLPALLRDVAKLGKRVVLMGQGNKFEIWSDEVWEVRQRELFESRSDETLSTHLESISL